MGTDTIQSLTSRPAALDAATVAEAFQTTAAERPDQPAVRTPGGDLEWTFAQLNDKVRRIAAGLAAMGVGRGDTVAMMLVNRPEFHACDLAALHLGAVPFSVYNTSSPEQVEYLFSNAENRVVICERQFLPVIQAANAPSVEHVVLIDGDDEGTIPLADLEGRGAEDFDFEAAWRAVQPDDVLTLIYTSGTTGPPKGVQLTHHGIMEENRAVAPVLPMTPGGRTASYLPSAHIADRWASYYYPLICFGATLTAVADPKLVVGVLPEVRPTAWGAVPRIWEKIMAALQAQGINDPSALPDEVKAGVRAKLGLDQVEWLISGAAPISSEVLQFFMDLGLPICELWGMSEISCCGIVNPPDDIRIGTVGKALPGVELKLEEDGELCVRGSIVMKGYRNDPEKTAEAIDSDGWLHTGDIAEIDGDGYVRIVDRKKELIINAGGKNMSPANIEQRVKASSPIIGQAVAIGDRRPYNVALIVLDPDNAADLDPDDPGVIAQVQEGVEKANAQLSRVEQIKKFKILREDWMPGGDELTPTMKLKRKPIAEKYAKEIEELYAS
ncbi:MAG TPA: AMP-binding protein [Baekduia sp.]|nr:AMP-binding protein [Baekduia sp.]